MKSELYARLDGRWKLACRLLFGREIGELTQYENWLKEDLEPIETHESILSGKSVYAVGKYPKDAPFISFDELDYSKKFEPISIDDIKDIDSLRQAIKERVKFCGNAVLGNSSKVESSTGIEDCHFVFGCHTFHKSQDIAYCTIGREVESSFGSSVIGESVLNIKGHNTWKTSRCLCVFRVYESSDIAFSNHLDGCNECMFCFGLKGKRHMIGNVQLPKEKYAELKKKLLDELADELEKNGRLPSLPELAAKEQPKTVKKVTTTSTLKYDETPVQTAFDETCSVIFGKKLGGVRSFERYLSRNTRGVTTLKSAVSDAKVFIGGYQLDIAISKTRRVVKLEEQDKICTERDWPEEISLDSISFPQIEKLISPIAFFTTEENALSTNVSETSTAHYAINVLGCSRAYHAKDCAYSCWPRDCDHMFGCDATRNSSFCINCYNSYRLVRCFEADTSQDCTGCYFIHNCENVHESMFCFNVKNLRYAVGNVEVGREKFILVKKKILGEIVSSFEKNKSFGVSIYDIINKRS